MSKAVTNQPVAKSREGVEQEKIRQLFRQFAEKQRRQAQDRDEPKVRIAAAAFSLFAEKGFNATGIREIAERAEVNPAMIHYYFVTKEQLYRYVIVSQFAIIAASLSSLDFDLPVERIVRVLPERILGVCERYPLWKKLILRELAEGGTYLENAITELGEDGPLGLNRLLSSAYQRGVKDGKVRKLPNEMIGPLLIGYAYGIAFTEPFFRILSSGSKQTSSAYTQRTEFMLELLSSSLIVKQGGKSK